MHFSIICGLSFMCVTMVPLLPVQGQPRGAMPKHPNDRLAPVCCPKVSKFHITDTVVACFEQKKDSLAGCKIHAYIFITESKQQFCVDPTASWLPARLQKIQKRGIICKILLKVNSQDEDDAP